MKKHITIYLKIKNTDFKLQGEAIMELNEFFTTVILTAAVFAALVTSIANIIISLMNNWRLKK